MADRGAYDENMQKLRQRFLYNLREWLPVLIELNRIVKEGTFAVERIESVRVHIHKCVGSAETFGFPDLTKLARKVESKLDELASGKALDDAYTIEVVKTFNAFIDCANKHLEEDIIESEGGYPFFKSGTIEDGDYDHHIIVVDDDDLIRDAIRDGLSGKKIKITFAEDGLRFLKKLERENVPKPDLIILDVNMPRVDGFEVLRTIKAMPETQTMPVIMLTRRDSEEDIKLGKSFGITEYVTKPFNIKEFITLVELALVND